MISFFKISTPYKFLFLFFIFLALRIPALLHGIPFIVPELNWMLVAERMGNGFVLYKEIWDDTSPLSALVFWIIHILFGKSPFIYQIIASLLIFIQAITFNQVLQDREVYVDRTMIPALLYIVLMSCFIDYFILTPVLMANTFLIIVIRYILLHISERRKYNAVFEIGAYTGIASLFYLPSFFILFVPIFSFLMFTGTKFRDYLLMAFAFLFTIGIAFLGFYMMNSEYDFYLNVFDSVLYLKPLFYVNLKDIIILFSVPFLLVIFNFLKMTSYKRYTNYQNRCQSIMVLWFFFSLVTIFLDSKVSAYSLTITILGIVFLLGHYFLMMQHTLLKELLFLLLLGNSIFFTYATIYDISIPVRAPFLGWEGFNIEIRTDDLVVRDNFFINKTKGKKILVCGNDVSCYQGAKLATPYLNWRLAQRHLTKMDQYFDIKTEIYKNIFDNEKKDIPEVIIDIDGTAKKIFEEMPLAAKNYEKIENTNIYIRKNKRG